MDTAKIMPSSNDIVIFHVGGSGESLGPIDEIIMQFPQRCILFCFEARELAEDKIMMKTYSHAGVRAVLVNRCIAETTGISPFYINKHGESSGLLPPSKSALGEHIAYPNNIHTWGDNTELERQIMVNAISLQDFIDVDQVVPDVLSIDAQGAELSIMRGLGHYISAINCIVSEVEFVEVYADQGLFHEQMAYLDSHGFRLADLLNRQYWHPGPVCGKGFFTVAEALWFRKISSVCESHHGQEFSILCDIKRAAVAFSLGYYSYSYVILANLVASNGSLVSDICSKYDFPILLEMTTKIQSHLGDYDRDNLFFLKHPITKKVKGGYEHKPLSHALIKWGRQVIRHLPV